MNKSSQNESSQPSPAEAVPDPDFYMDGPYLVFTAIYHRKRGYCCESGCRHCPWREEPDASRTG